MQRNKTSTPGARRGLLKRCLAALGGGLGVGLLAKETASRELPKSNPSGSVSLKLYGRSWHLYGDGHRIGESPRTGERLTAYGELLDPTISEPAGEFHAAILGTASPSDAGNFATGTLEYHTFKLAEGTLIGMGAAAPGEGVFAVVGGTGRYSGASGSYTAQQRPYDLGGDGSAEFTFNLTIPTTTTGGRDAA
jgi:hypothetical protein